MDEDSIRELSVEIMETVFRFYGSEAEVNNAELFVSLANLLSFSMVERFSDDWEILARLGKVFETAIAEQRKLAQTLPNHSTVGPRLN